MRTVQVLIVGFLLLGASILVGRLFEQAFQSARSTACIAFVAVWLAFTMFNMGIGVLKAGYTVGEESPIFIVLFAIPAGAAIGLRWLGW